MGRFLSQLNLGVEPVVRSRLVASRHLAEAVLGRRWVVHQRLLCYVSALM
jgi:hypothetical protein